MECPLCSGAPHDTNHLFNCPANPTSLTPFDLWTSPAKVASFLELKTERECGEEQYSTAGNVVNCHSICRSATSCDPISTIG
ncbi:hypothetical protein M8J77_022717 [Diaphorina citri]|nr:hypothetical protein M8J77_022717 [Diaphorina citri]